MQKIWLIIQREYLVQVGQKSFVAMTVLVPIFLIGLGRVFSFLNRVASTNHQVVVIDENPQQKFAMGLKSNQNLTFFFFDPSERSIAERRLKEKSGNIDALLIIPNGTELSRLEQNIQLYTKDQTDLEFSKNLIILLNKKLENLKLQENGIDPDLLRRATADIHLKIIPLKGTIDQNIEIKRLLSIVMMYAVMMFILIYGVRIMRSVIEEKNSHIVEIIVSSVKPFQLMIGKIFGTALVALTQFIIWICFILLAAYTLRDLPIYESHGSGAMMSQIKTLFQNLFHADYLFLISMFLIYFIGGYLFFSAFFATIGSIMEAESESQQYSILASIVLAIGFYAGVITINHPTGWMPFWLSIFPLTSPIVMLARIPYDIPIWQLLFSLSILFLSVWGMIFLAAKIYRVSILKFGAQNNPIKNFFKFAYRKK